MTENDENGTDNGVEKQSNPTKELFEALQRGIFYKLPDLYLKKSGDDVQLYSLALNTFPSKPTLIGEFVMNGSRIRLTDSDDKITFESKLPIEYLDLKAMRIMFNLCSDLVAKLEESQGDKSFARAQDSSEFRFTNQGQGPTVYGRH